MKAEETMSDRLRIVEVERTFYRDLMLLLQPGERWYDDVNKGTVLYSYDFQTGETTKLVFKPKGAT